MRAISFLGAFAIFFSPVALAAEAIKVDLVPKAQKGQGSPELVVRAERPLAKLVLDVARSTDGKRLKLSAGPVHAGREHRFLLEVNAVGPAQFRGSLSVALENGEKGEMPIDVGVELLEPLSIEVRAEDVDLAKKQLKLSSNRELKSVEVATMSDTGTPLGTTTVDLDARDGDGKYVVAWEQKKGTVLRISVKGIDPSGFYGGVDLFPWRVDIPHEEVNFRTGSFDIDQPESPKLEKSYALIDDAIKKYGKLATIKLYVAGHTDSVGDNGSNLTLSNNRARAIGRWFKKRGVKIPILYAGFGESALLVETPDETDEVKNRRAEYIVAVEAPRMKGSGRFAPLD